MTLLRRSLLALALAALALPALAKTVTDATGRIVTVPDNPARVFAAGPPASVLLYALKPEAMLGWVKAPKDADKALLAPEVRDLPELGRLTGKGDTLNLETLLAAKPDLILDFGTVSPTYADLAQKVQDQTGVPYVLIDGSFANTPAAIRQVADLLGVPERGEALAAFAEKTLAAADAALAAVPQDKRPTVYLARGAEGLESAGPKSINAEIISRAGAVNVITAEDRGLVTTSPEQILALAPQVIVTVDKGFAAGVAGMDGWKDVPAVKDGRVYLAPSAPFGFIDSPPSVNRLIGLDWMLHRLYPNQAQGDLSADVREFYKLFYHVDLDDAALAKLIGK